MAKVSGAMVLRAVAALNDKAEQLGMRRRFEFHRGSWVNGVFHTLVELQPELQHPVGQTSIGKTLPEALAYVTAMNHALLAVLVDRDFRRHRVENGG